MSCYNWSLINRSCATFKLQCFSGRVELAVCFIDHLYPLLTSALDGGEWWPRASQFTSGIKLGRTLVGLHTRHGRCLTDKISVLARKRTPIPRSCNPWPSHCCCCKDQIQHVSGLLPNYFFHISMSEWISNTTKLHAFSSIIFAIQIARRHVGVGNKNLRIVGWRDL
jgi:hypothetical protein